MNLDINVLAEELINQEKIELEIYPTFWKIKFKGKENYAGVYILRNREGKIVYVGETRTITHRVKDLLNTHNHGFRKAVFNNFISINNKDYDEDIHKDYRLSKKIISEYICKNFTFSYLQVAFGRKELEEYIIENKEYSKDLFNIRGIKKIK